MAFCNKDQVLVTNYAFGDVVGGVITPALPSGAAKAQSGDVIIIVIAARRSVGNWLENGTAEYTMIQGTQYNGVQHTIAWKAASGSDVARSFKNAAISGCEATAMAMVWKDADTTTPIPDRLFATIASFPHTFGSGLTVSNNNSAVVYIATHAKNFGSLMTAKMDGAREIAQSVGGSTWTSTICGEKTKTVAGSASSLTVLSTDNTENGASLTFAVKNASGGTVYPEVSIDVDSVDASNEFPNLFGSLGVNSKAITWATPDAWIGTGGTIDGYSCSTTADTITTTAAGVTYTYAPFTKLSNSTNYSTSPKWCGGGIDFTSAINMSGKMFGLIWSSSLGAAQLQVQDDGLIVVFKDNQGTPAWAAFTLHKKAKLVIGLEYTSIIALGAGRSTPTFSSGTIDWTNIKGIAFLKLKTNGLATTWDQLIKHGILFSKVTVTGGYVDSPAKFSDVVLPLNAWDKGGMAGQQAITQVQLPCNLQIGDGSAITYWDSSGQSAAFPPEYGVSETTSAQDKVNVLPGALSIVLKTSASDIINLTADIIGTSQEQDFTIDAASSTAAAVSLAGASVVGFNPSLLDGFAFDGVTFSGCGPLNTKGADLTSCLITDTTAAASEAAVAVDTSGSVLDGCTIDITGTAAGYHIELGTACTGITLTDVTFTGTPATDKVHVKKTTGTVTITISGSTSLLAADVTSDGATVVIDAPQPTLDATVLSGSRVVLYNDTTDAELDNTAPAGTSWSKTITSGASIGDTLTLHVFKEGYEEFSTSFLYAGTDTTLLVTQTVHPHIASLRTELGITDYTTITEFALDITGTVEIDADDADGNTQKARLAIWYNGILTTEDGARYLRGAITILSPAAIRINVDVIDLLVANISATFGLNFTDTDRRLYRSDGSPIYAAASAPGSIQNDYSGVPDTIETGVSGLTGAESAQLMALPSAATVATAVWSKELPL